MTVRGGARHPGGCLTDVTGIAVGHHSRSGRGWRTGTTVVLLPPDSVVGVDVRGGGPGTRETDLLHPTATITTAHAICLTGGSAYGLAAADGVMEVLEQRGVGFQVGQPGQAGRGVVPLVPAAVIFDLGRGGVFANRPDRVFGIRAARAARRAPMAQGAVGAGTGTRAGGVQGGVGAASTTLAAADGSAIVVAALAVVNAAGSPIDLGSGQPWMPGSDRLRRPSAGDRERLRRHVVATVPPLNTTIGVVATSARLSKAECGRLSTVAHDGLARAVRPVHSLLDGDTIFAAATGEHELLDVADAAPGGRIRLLNRILTAAADCFATACTNAVVRADGDGSYRQLCPSAFPVSRALR
jgi:L-aminopeptidase/D-esterase-like protein